MQEKQFLRQLQKEAQLQVPLESAHLFPSRFRRFSAWIWQHSWQVWLIFAFIFALIFEFWQGRCQL